jgi:hypothetical protein
MRTNENAQAPEDQARPDRDRPSGAEVNGLAAAKDLTRGAPRGLDAELEGYAWLPRMLDKARATLAGTAGSYLFGCPVDHTCMARLGISPDLVLDLAARHVDDHAVLEALRAHGIPSAADAWFDGQAVEDELQETGNYLRVRAREGLPEANAGRLFAGAEHGANVSVLLGRRRRWPAAGGRSAWRRRDRDLPGLSGCTHSLPKPACFLFELDLEALGTNGREDDPLPL